MKICNVCKTITEDAQQYCNHCGSDDFSPFETKRCPFCNIEVAKGTVVCPHCHRILPPERESGDVSVSSKAAVYAPEEHEDVGKAIDNASPMVYYGNEVVPQVPDSATKSTYDAAKEVAPQAPKKVGAEFSTESVEVKPVSPNYIVTPEKAETKVIETTAKTVRDETPDKLFVKPIDKTAEPKEATFAEKDEQPKPAALPKTEGTTIIYNQIYSGMPNANGQPVVQTFKTGGDGISMSQSPNDYNPIHFDGAPTIEGVDSSSSGVARERGPKIKKEIVKQVVVERVYENPAAGANGACISAAILTLIGVATFLLLPIISAASGIINGLQLAFAKLPMGLSAFFPSNFEQIAFDLRLYGILYLLYEGICFTATGLPIVSLATAILCLFGMGFNGKIRIALIVFISLLLAAAVYIGVITVIALGFGGLGYGIYATLGAFALALLVILAGYKVKERK